MGTLNLYRKTPETLNQFDSRKGPKRGIYLRFQNTWAVTRARLINLVRNKISSIGYEVYLVTYWAENYY